MSEFDDEQEGQEGQIGTPDSPEEDSLDDLLSDDGPDVAADEGAEDDWAAAMAEQMEAETVAEEEATSGEAGGGVERASMPDLQAEESDDEGKVNLDMILDIPVTIAMEIGRTRINIRNLLQLNQGSVVELDRFAGEPLDVLVNGTLIAHGEVVVVNEKFGIRLTDVISAQERLKKIK